MKKSKIELDDAFFVSQRLTTKAENGKCSAK